MVGFAMFAIGLIGLIFTRHRVLLGALLLSGVCWSVVFRNYVAFHDFASVFYVGIPLLCFSVLMGCLRRSYAHPIIALVTLPVFVASVVQVARIGHSPEQARLKTEIMDDFAAISTLVDREDIVYLPIDVRSREFAGAPFGQCYFLAGRILEHEHEAYSTVGVRERTQGRWHLAQYVILSLKIKGPALLTPDNRHRFLYDRERLQRDGSLFGGLDDPLIEFDYDAYLKGSKPDHPLQ